MARMNAVQVPRAGGAFELVLRPLPEPQAGQVRLKVEACGVCHSDSFVKEGGAYPVAYPRIPGHGVVDALGAGVRLASLIGGTRAIQGWTAGTAMDSEDTLQFSVLRQVRPLVETFPLEQAGEAYERMLSNRVRFRAVLLPPPHE